MSGALAALLGARIRRVDVPEPDLLALTLGGGDLDREIVLVISTDPAAPGLGCVPDRPRGRPAEGVAKQLRNLLEGARLERAIETGGGALAVDLRRGEDVLALVHESLAARSNTIVLDAEGRAIAALHPRRLALRGLRLGEPWSPAELVRIRDVPGDLDTLGEAGASLLARRRELRDRARRAGLERGIRKTRQRLERRAHATLEDLDRLSEVPGLRARGSAILAALHTIPRGATELELPDYASDPPRAVRVTIDPAIGPRGSADALFARARKLEAGAAIASARHDEALAIVARLDALREQLASEDADLDTIEAGARKLGVALERASTPRRHEPDERAPFRRYVGHGERTILVGRTGRDNDALTFQHARPHDLWLHVRGLAGSHVIVPLARDEACPQELLLDAAHLAAHFSSARGEPQLEIQYAPRKHLKKPKGGAPGQVIVTQEKVFVLRLEPRRLTRLLGRTAEE